MKYDAYYDGVFGFRNKVTVPLKDRSIFFGDGIYDAAIGRNGKIFMLDEHIERFMSNSKRLNLPTDFKKETLRELLLKIAAFSEDDSDYFIYFQLNRCCDERTHSYGDDASSKLLITRKNLVLPPLSKKLTLVRYPDIRYQLCDVKTVNLLPAVLASRYATEQGADEAVFCKGEKVTECAHSNVSIIRNGKVYSHPADSNILNGISRQHMIKVCYELGIPFSEAEFSAEEMRRADEVLVTSSSKLCLMAESFDGAYYSGEHTLGRLIATKMRNDYFAST